MDRYSVPVIHTCRSLSSPRIVGAVDHAPLSYPRMVCRRPWIYLPLLFTFPFSLSLLSLELVGHCPENPIHCPSLSLIHLDHPGHRLADRPLYPRRLLCPEKSQQISYPDPQKLESPASLPPCRRHHHSHQSRQLLRKLDHHGRALCRLPRRRLLLSDQNHRPQHIALAYNRLHFRHELLCVRPCEKS